MAYRSYVICKDISDELISFFYANATIYTKYCDKILDNIGEKMFDIFV